MAAMWIVHFEMTCVVKSMDQVVGPKCHHWILHPMIKITHITEQLQHLVEFGLPVGALVIGFPAESASLLPLHMFD